MKVKLREYQSRTTSYNVLRDWFGRDTPYSETYDWLDKHPIIDRILGAIGSIYDWFYNWRVVEKIVIEDEDLWDLHSTLAKIILPSLILFKERTHGYPNTDREDAPADPRYDDKDLEDYSVGYSPERWNHILDEMIFAFSYVVNESEIDQDRLIWTDYKRYEERQARVANGLKLFGKYYRSLWI